VAHAQMGFGGGRRVRPRNKMYGFIELSLLLWDAKGAARQKGGVGKGRGEPGMFLGKKIAGPDTSRRMLGLSARKNRKKKREGEIEAKKKRQATKKCQR